jgi:hypothetical protein
VGRSRSRERRLHGWHHHSFRRAHLGEVVAAGIEVLMAGAVAYVEHRAPEEVGGETAPKDDNEDGQVLPERTSSRIFQCAQRDFPDRSSGREPVSEARAEHPGKCGNEHALLEVELLHRGSFLLRGKFALFGHSRGAADGDAEQARAHACEDGETGRRGEQ